MYVGCPSIVTERPPSEVGNWQLTKSAAVQSRALAINAVPKIETHSPGAMAGL
jgi:hypothetical protein